MIGVGVTTYGRSETAGHCIQQLKNMLPDGAKFHIAAGVEGIVQAKNDCLRNLDHCEHIFLFDDDIYPTVKDWHLPYILTGEKHLSYTFGRNVIGYFDAIKVLEKPCGCMLYIHNDCINAVGGFDEAYTVYAGEHEDFSRRVYNAGLTTHPYMDYAFSQTLFHSLDEHKQVKGSIDPMLRARAIPCNMKRLKQQFNSKEFKAYK